MAMPMLASTSMETPPRMNGDSSEALVRRGHVEGVRRLAGVEIDAELVAAEAGHGVALAEGERQAPAHLVEQLVAEVMAQGVVDLLEPVEVHHDHPHRLAAAPGRGDGVLQA